MEMQEIKLRATGQPAIKKRALGLGLINKVTIFEQRIEEVEEVNHSGVGGRK